MSATPTAKTDPPPRDNKGRRPVTVIAEELKAAKARFKVLQHDTEQYYAAFNLRHRQWERTVARIRQAAAKDGDPDDPTNPYLALELPPPPVIDHTKGNALHAICYLISSLEKEMEQYTSLDYRRNFVVETLARAGIALPFEIQETIIR